MKKLLTILSMTCLCLFADEFVESSTTVGGYGELHFDMEGNDGDGKLDFHRFILYVKHTFNDQWSMMSEIEIEHNMVYSEGDGGYLAMEQAYLNYWNGKWGFKGGVLLVPAGITNEYHEPPTFMSVERPEYSKYIIPTTWFDNGFSFYGKMNNLNWNFTMVGDLNGDEIGEGIRNARMKGVYSTATDWTKTLQLSWAGMDGLKLGGSMTTNDAPVSAIAGEDESWTWAWSDPSCDNPDWDPTTGEAGCTGTDWDHDGDDGASTAEQAGEFTATEYAATHHEGSDPVEATTIGVQLMEINGTYSKNNIYARFEYGQVDYTDNPSAESSSGYYVDLGYNVADMMGCDGDLYLWTRTSSYNKNDDDDSKDISLFGVTYKPVNNIAIKFESGTAGDDDVMRMGLGYMF